MNIKFDLLYKNGHEESITMQLVTKEEVARFNEFVETVEKAFRENIDASVTLGDGLKSGMYVRVSELARVRTTVLDEVMA